MNTAIQMSLGLPLPISLNLQKPLFFNYKKLKCGVLYQVVLSTGRHEVTAVHKQGFSYEISDSSGCTFNVELKYKNGSYEVQGFAEYIEDVNYAGDFRIDGSGKCGEKLRKAQCGAIYSLLSHWSLTTEPATIVLPTGTGKTETMFVASLADRSVKTLVVVPTIELKLQTAEKFSTWGMLRKLGVITGKTSNPSILTLNTTISDVSELENVEVVITTPALIARATQKVKDQLKQLFSHVFFDEAHHIEASEWRDLKSLFSKAKVVQFTATPYRNDRKPVEGKIVYNYALSQALKDECFSRLSLISVDQRHPKLKDKAIAEAAMSRLLDDRKNGWKRHRMMVRTETTDHAKQLLDNYKEWFPNERIVLIHSQTKGKKALYNKLKVVIMIL